jgi:hypothetical protein
VSTRAWWLVLGSAAAVRVAIPLAALAASGHDLPGMPAYDYAPLHGDANGFYAAAREFLASFGRVATVVAGGAALAVAGAAVAGVLLWRRGHRWEALVVSGCAVSFVVTLVVRQMEPAGAAVFGWPLTWAAAMLPYRVLGLPLDPDVAFVFGLGLSLLALAATTVGTAYAGFYASGRHAVGLLAAWAFAVWPLVTGALTGGRAWENGQWNVDVGLHLYTEPLSTALVLCAIALLLRPHAGDVTLALTGLLLGLATVTKLTNGIVAAVLVLVVAASDGVRRVLPLALGGLVFLPVVVAYWPLGYGPIYDETGERLGAFWSLSAVADAWADSLLFTPLVVAILLAGVVAGAVALRDRPRCLALLAAPIVVNAVAYSFYTVTAVHPRFLYEALPAVFVLAAAGAAGLAGQGTRPAGLPQTES